MQNVSSILTMGYRIFIPVFFTVLFSLMVFAGVTTDSDYIGSFPRTWFLYFFITILLLHLLITYFTFWQWRRVEMSENELYVTDYFKHAKYSMDSIDSIKETNFIILKVNTIYLKAKGIFGDKIKFVPSGRRWPKFLKSHPTVATLLKRRVS